MCCSVLFLILKEKLSKYVQDKPMLGVNFNSFSIIVNNTVTYTYMLWVNLVAEIVLQIAHIALAPAMAGDASDVLYNAHDWLSILYSLMKAKSCIYLYSSNTNTLNYLGIDFVLYKRDTRK